MHSKILGALVLLLLIIGGALLYFIITHPTSFGYKNTDIVAP